MPANDARLETAQIHNTVNYFYSLYSVTFDKVAKSRYNNQFPQNVKIC